MTDKELIQALKHCGDPDKAMCYGCPARKVCRENPGLPIDRMAADRLEALLAENEHLREVTKMIPKWVSVSERLPEMQTEKYSDIDGEHEFQISASVLGLTKSGGMAIVRCELNENENPAWIDEAGTEYEIVFWCIPEPPSTEGGGVHESLGSL